MKVLMTADTVGGVFTYAVELAHALGPYGVEVALATMGGPVGEAQRGALRALPHVTFYESDFKLEWMDDPWDDVEAAADWLMQVQDEVQPDLIHLNGYAHGACDWRAPVLVVGHSCVCSWFEAVRRKAAPPQWDRYRRVVRDGLAAADAVAAPTQAMLEALERHYGPLPPAHVVPNGRDPRHYQPAKKEPVILAAGRVWDEAKGLHELAAIAPDLSWPIRLAGDAEHPDGGRAHFENVELLGPLPSATLAAEMARAAIYALPARYEPFGLSALEAALSGCALVLGDIPSLREVWGDAALFVDGEAALRDTLCRLIEDDTLRADYAARALARAGRFTPERMADRYLALYRLLLQDAPSGTSGDGAPAPIAELPHSR